MLLTMLYDYLMFIEVPSYCCHLSLSLAHFILIINQIFFFYHEPTFFKNMYINGTVFKTP